MWELVQTLPVVARVLIPHYLILKRGIETQENFERWFAPTRRAVGSPTYYSGGSSAETYKNSLSSLTFLVFRVRPPNLCGN